MSDALGTPPITPVTPGRDGQVVVSLAIVIAMTVLGLAGIIAAVLEHDLQLVGVLGVGTIIGSFATALNTPTGVSNALRVLKAGSP